MKPIMTINTITTDNSFVHEIFFKSEIIRSNFYEAIDSVFSCAWTSYDSDSEIRTSLEHGMVLGDAYHKSLAIILVDESSLGNMLEELADISEAYSKEVRDPKDDLCPEFNKAVKDYIRTYKRYKKQINHE